MSWYDRAEIYDLLFDWDPATERDFVLGASERFGISGPRRILEPFCGPGRMLRAMPGLVTGFDWNARMVRHAARNSRVFRADAARFAVRPGSFDLAFCLIDSFRHLGTEQEAFRHLRSIARALRPGAVYVLGFDLTGDLPGGDVSSEEWTVERDGVRASFRYRALGDPDPDTRFETAQVVIDVERGGRTEKIEEFQPMRVYSREQFGALLAAEGSFGIAGCFRRNYDLERPVPFEEVSGSVVLVLRVSGGRRGGPGRGSPSSARRG